MTGRDTAEEARRGRRTRLWHLSLAIFPLLTLGAYFAGGEIALITSALALPLGVAIVALFERRPAPAVDRDQLTRDGLVAALDDMCARIAQTGRQTAVFAIGIDEVDGFRGRHGVRGTEIAFQLTRERLRGVLREGDYLAASDDHTCLVLLGPGRRLDLESCIQLAARLQGAAAEPISNAGETLNLSVSVGFCLPSREKDMAAPDIVAAAETALLEGLRNGPSAIRAWVPDMARKRVAKGGLVTEIAQALEAGQIVPWFQPQLATKTGRISGIEALARWEHPVRGLIPPSEFLPVIHDAGLTERLGEVMLFQALAALRRLDEAEANIPTMGVNFAGAELRDPRLVEKISWELDRFDLAPDRLCAEILETVLADSEGGVVTRNIRGLAQLGCRIDLDDFGIGQASIARIQNFSVDRIKIDRSFVNKVDRDADQRKLVTAILTMARELEVDTLAEGVETKGEHAILTQIGCNHVQGFAIARPMPEAEALSWCLEHQRALSDTVEIRRVS